MNYILHHISGSDIANTSLFINTSQNLGQHLGAYWSIPYVSSGELSTALGILSTLKDNTIIIFDSDYEEHYTHSHIFLKWIAENSNEVYLVMCNNSDTAKNIIKASSSIGIRVFESDNHIIGAIDKLICRVKLRCEFSA